MTNERLIRWLPVPLTTEEFEAKAAELAQINLEMSDIRDAKKAAVADFNARIEERVAKVGVLAAIVDKRTEIREVDCVERVDIDRKLVDIIRADTGEVVDHRGITQRDIQQALPMDITDDDSKQD